ncbi:hypothetical protein CDAR_46251 [Caerostris darwini]|uniref:Uncharacterized protein n=1 Tax=Caerostris darwini TaxID=1538125 RepID=A0AAV4PJS1_9ARAC|nr:hypothetical protein CDAR_46251 [Caerostris darwini]
MGDVRSTSRNQDIVSASASLSRTSWSINEPIFLDYELNFLACWTVCRNFSVLSLSPFGKHQAAARLRSSISKCASTATYSKPDEIDALNAESLDIEQKFIKEKMHAEFVLASITAPKKLALH